jgi:hypothetical protein
MADIETSMLGVVMGVVSVVMGEVWCGDSCGGRGDG